jgi:hypothetical protein
LPAVWALYKEVSEVAVVGDDKVLGIGIVQIQRPQDFLPLLRFPLGTQVRQFPQQLHVDHLRA